MQAPTPMAGFPPAPESRLGPENWSHLPWLRWSHLNRSRMLPSATAWRGDGPVLDVPAAPQDLGGLMVARAEGGAPERLDDLLAALHCNAFLVLHRGRVVWERFWHGMRAEDRHMVASISKSICGLLAGILAAQGAVVLGRAVEHYVPELRGRPIGDATLQQLLDMTAAVARPPMPWRDPQIGGQDGGVYEALGLLPWRDGAPEGLFPMVAQRPRDPAVAAHGQRFFYDNGQTEAVSWALARATGIDPAMLVQDLLWRRIGAERDAFVIVDRQAMPSLSGGVATTLRDLARLGEMMRLGGTAFGRQVVPEAFLADIARGGDRAHFAPTPYARDLPGGSYRSFWYLGHDAHGTLLANGRYGQRLWISPRSELVVAQFSSIPGPPPQPEAHALAQIWRALAQDFAPA